MKGDLIRPTKTLEFEGEKVVDSNIVYRVMEVSPNGVAWAHPIGEEPRMTPNNVRLFYLCAPGEVEVL